LRFRLAVGESNLPLLTGGHYSEVVVKAGLTVQSNLRKTATFGTQKFTVIQKWSLFKGCSLNFTISIEILGIRLAVVNRWPLFRGGR